jgi:SAM-dependent methyltransferase
MRENGYSRYLRAKRSVDDRALNWHVLERLRSELAKNRASTVSIVEIGAGVGTMVARLLEMQIIGKAEYLMLDASAELLEEARPFLTAWARSNNLAAQTDGEAIRIRGGAEVDVVVRFAPEQLDAFLARASPARADLLIASAFLDLIDVPSALPKLVDLLVPEGLFYFALNFDGETTFEPEHVDDGPLLRLYHRSMDESRRDGRRAGDSRCGRHLFGHLRALGAPVLAAGASDWTVYAHDGQYPADEAHFLHAILDTVGAELRGHAEISLDRLDAWLALRRRQIERGELVYIAHQLDYVGRSPAASVRPKVARSGSTTDK